MYEFSKLPQVKRARQEIELDDFQKQYANLMVVGRYVDANIKLVEFTQDFVRKAVWPNASQKGLSRLSYAAAYVWLPKMVHENWTEFARFWGEGLPMAMYVALYGSIREQTSITLNQLMMFNGEAGQLTDDTKYFLLSFPTPLSNAGVQWRLDTIESIPIEDRPFLGPYFAAALSNVRTGRKQWYVLNQAPAELVSLRCVTADGANLNQGFCCEASIEAFLDILRKHV